MIKKLIALQERGMFILTLKQLKNFFSKREIERIEKEGKIYRIFQNIFLIVGEGRFDGKRDTWKLYQDALSVYLTERFGNNYALIGDIAIHIYNRTLSITDFKDVFLCNARNIVGKSKLSRKDFEINITYYHKLLTPVVVKGTMGNLNLNIASTEELLFDIFSDKNNRSYLNKDIVLFCNNQHFDIIILQKIFKGDALKRKLADFCLKNNIKNKNLLLFLKKYNCFPIEKITSDQERYEESFMNNMEIFYKRLANFVNEFSKTTQWEKIKLPQKISEQEVLKHLKNIEIADVFNNLTIEGYRTTTEQVEFILYKKYPNFIHNLEQKIEFENQIENELFVKSFHNLQVNCIEQYIPQKAKIDKNLFYNIHYDIFSKLYEKQGIARDEIEVRNKNVAMRGVSSFNPPSPKELPFLLEKAIDYINLIDDVVLKAMYAHFILIPTQFFQDGNGRLSRTIMNIILAQNGYKWITIDEHDYRLKYLSNWEYISFSEWDNIKKLFIEFLKFMLKSLLKMYK